MKRYILALAVMVVVFLWLENVTMGQSIPPCDLNVKCTVTWHVLSSVDCSKDISWLTCTCQEWYKQVDNKCKSCADKDVCCGVALNTWVPFIGKCIESKTGYVGGDETWVTSEDAFPVLMSSLTQILVTVILIVSLLLIIVGGIMIATGNPSGGKKMIINVVIGIALLWASGVILRLINPNFFG